MVHGIFLRFLNIATFLYIDSTTMSMWRPLFLTCMILDHKLQRMLNDSKIAQLNSERPLHQTAVIWTWAKYRNTNTKKLYMVCNLDLRKTQKSKYKNLCAYHIQSGLEQNTEVQIQTISVYGIQSWLEQIIEIQIQRNNVKMVSLPDLVKTQKYKYKESLCMVFNLDLSKLQKYKYKESLCKWYPFQTWSKYRNTNTKNLCLWYSILTWTNYRNTTTENLCAYGIPSRLGQNTEIQIQKSLWIWYPIWTWAKYRNTNTKNLCACGIEWSSPWGLE